MNQSRIQGVGMTSARTRERLIKRLMENGITNTGVLDVVRNVPRHMFVQEALASRAYEDDALPIGFGQTISQPLIVALMTQALLEEPDGSLRKMKKVLEIGTGCGYQTAVLSPLVGTVYSIERVAPLLQETRKRLSALQVANIRLRRDDGHRGWPGQAPFDGIIVTAAPPEIPQKLLDQLAPDGRLVMPVGQQDEAQTLMRITATESGFEEEMLGKVAFVPMVED
ncbi:MAG: protein-L-isoaspartate(D-aspartate) O-methyltransferase [Gammaproteobacteria bacterium]|nr:protein-L-isoaspartate(D-aspartate) O-methyltransferase [Gammaproteobacteria bacterium]